MTAAEQNVLEANHAKEKDEPLAGNALVPPLKIAVVEIRLSKSEATQNACFSTGKTTNPF